MTAGTLKLVLAYALFAGLWILLSDNALVWLFDDPANIVLASTLKGWLFVAVTSVLLYGLVRRLRNQDLTSSRREREAQTEYLRSQELLAAIVDSSSDAIFAKDRQGRYLLFNREFVRASGKGAQLALGCDDTLLFPPEQAETIRADDRRVIGENQTSTYEETLSSVDGERTYLTTKGPLRDGAGQVIGLFGISRDITERTRAEHDVRMLSRALEQSPAAIVITDRAGNIEYVNPRFEQISGYTRAEAVGRNPRFLKSGENAAQVYQQLWETISSGGQWRGELCNRRKNGELFWEFAEISGVRGENGEIEHYVAVKEDITERKASDAKIQRLGNLYAALSECNQAVMHCANEQALFQQVCAAVVNFGGMKLAWIGMVDEASKLVVPLTSFGDVTGYLQTIEVSVDAGTPAGRGPAGAAIRENRPSWCQDYLHDPTTAHWHERARRAGWQAAAALPLCRNGIPIGAISIYSSEPNAFDQAARALVGEMAANISFALDNFTREADRRLAEELLKESESRLSAVFQASPIGISVTRVADGKILEVNDAALRMYGYMRDEAIGRTVAELGVHANLAQREELVQRLREQARVEGFEADFRNRSGALVKVEVTGRVIELQGEQCLVAMMLDVTDRKRLEDVHLQAQKLESLGTLAGGIAHDFNNILAAIRGNVDLAVKEVGPDHVAAESLQEIRKASARAGELVRRILAFGRPAEAQQEVVDLGAVVGEVLSLLRSTLPAGISLRKEFAQDTPQVLADAGQVHEAIVNLTTNAAHAIGARGGSIEYRLEPVRVGKKLAQSIAGIKEGRYARLTVTDSGCGMHAGTLARIFDAFYTTKPVGEGTGLGLSMVHGTMRSHGGAVAVESTPGKGSSFALYFPVVRKKAQKKAQSAPARDLFYAGQRVLYVDDEEALVMLASRVLSHLGHQISGFIDPEQALAAFRAHPQDFDVVVTDLSMPHMSGFELAREVLAVRPGIPVLMTTGYIGAQDEGKARAAGIREVILKPVTMDELGDVLDRLIRTASSE
ncbi:MAG: hybrid sensor histidine kinase/response regulator [Burkholderiales bacterium]